MGERAAEFFERPGAQSLGRSDEVLEPSATLLHRMRCVDRLAKYVDEHLAHPLTLDELAVAAGMSKFHLHRAVASLAGETPAQLVLRSRLRSAMVRFRSAGPSTPRILDVALEVGFQDASAFSRSFRNHFGLTPSQALAGTAPAPPWRLPQRGSSAPSQGDVDPTNLTPRTLMELAPAARVASIPSFYCYGLDAVGAQERTFAKQAPQAFSCAFDHVERHGIEEVLGPMAVPSGSAWTESSELRLLCAFRSSRKLSLKHLTERKIVGGRYLVGRHVGPYESRWQEWSRLSTLRRSLLGALASSAIEGGIPFEVERGEGTGQPMADVYFPL